MNLSERGTIVGESIFRSTPRQTILSLLFVWIFTLMNWGSTTIFHSSALVDIATAQGGGPPGGGPPGQGGGGNLNQRVTDLETENILQQGQIDTNTTMNTAQDSAITGNQTDIATNQSDISNLQSENTIQQGQIDANTAINTAQDSAITGNQTDIATNQSDISNLQSENTIQQGQIDANTAINTAQDSAIAGNQTDIATNQSDISNLQSENAIQQGQINTNSADIASNRSDIIELQNNVKDFSDGVEILFATDIDYDIGGGVKVPALDLNGLGLHISGVTSTVQLSNIPLTVLHQGSVGGGIVQQVIVQLPGGLLPGDYRIALQNSQGDSQFDSTIGEPTSGGSGAIPSGAVMHFNLTSCPTDWTFLVVAQGRYLVGVGIGGTVGVAVGTALSNQENRAVGQHGHSASTNTAGNHSHSASTGAAGAHNHRISESGNGNFQNSFPARVLMGNGDGNHGQHNLIEGVGDHNHSVSVSGAGNHSHSVTVNSAGSVSGTNAPYLQLLTCQKN